MKARYRILLIVLLAGGLSTLGFRLLRPRDRLYAGKPARVWVKEWIEKRDETMSPEAAEISRLREVGTPAVNELVAAIKRPYHLSGSATYSNLHLRLPARWAARLPRPVNAKLVHIRAYWSLGMIGPASKPAAPFLAERLVNEPSLQSFAAFALGELGTNATAAVPTLVSALNHTKREIRFNAAEALMKIEPENASLLTKMFAELKSTDVVNRRMAGHVLGLRRPLGTPVEAALVVVFKDPDMWVRFRAADALFRNCPTNREYLAALVELAKSPEAQHGLLYDIAKVRPATRESVELISEWFRIFGARSSGHSYLEQYFEKCSAQDSNAVPALIEALADTGNGKLRCLAARALGGIGPPASSALPALRETAKDDSEDVQKAANAAINRISAQK